MNDWLKKNLSIKIVSIIIAIFLWLIASNYDNPIEVRNYSIPLGINNIESIYQKGMVITSTYPETISISVRARTKTFQNINERDFEVHLDFEKVTTSGVKETEINGPYYSGEEKITANVEGEKTISITVENIVRKSFDILVETTGEPAEGYIVTKYTVTPEIWDIEGPESQIEKISAAKIFVSIDQMNRDNNIRKSCRLIGENGVELTELGSSETYDVSINMAKTVDIIPFVVSSPLEGYIAGEATVSPDTIIIDGDSNILSNISSVYTNPVNIEDATTSISTEVNLVVPNGISLISDFNSVTLSVDIEKLATKTLTVMKEDISLEKQFIGDNLVIDILTESVDFNLRGRQEVLDNINIQDLSPRIDIPLYRDGVYTINLIYDLPTGVESIEATGVEVQVSTLGEVFIPTTNIALTGADKEGYYYSINNSMDIQIKVKGESSVLQDLTGEQMLATIDVSDLIEGTYTLPVTPSLPQDVYEAGLNTTNIIITKIIIAGE